MIAEILVDKVAEFLSSEREPQRRGESTERTDQEHCPHPLDVIVATAEGRTCMWCGVYDPGWDEVLRHQFLPWPAAGLPVVQKPEHVAPGGFSLAAFDEVFVFEPDWEAACSDLLKAP